MQANQDSNRISLFFFTFAIGCIITFITLDVLFYTYNIKKRLIHDASNIAKEKEMYLSSSANTTKDILLSIKSSKYFEKYINNTKEQDESLNDIFLILLKHDKNIMQLRYIDSSGMELIRVDRPELNMKPRIIEKSQLQDKSSRYYFKESINKESKVWYSNLDLNMEKGTVEIPYKPTLRAMLPIKEKDKFTGLLIINYNMDLILKNLINIPTHNLILIDESAHTLTHYDENKSWSNYRKIEFKLNEVFKTNINEIIKNDEFIGDDFISKKISLGLPKKLFFILQINDDYLKEITIDRYLHYFVLSAITIILSFIMSTLISKQPMS